MDNTTVPTPAPYVDLSAATGWKNAPTTTDLNADINSSRPAHDEHVAQLREWEAYHQTTGIGAAPKRKGRSQIQPKLIKKNAEWRHPSMSEPFLSSSKLFQVSPTTWEDKDAAVQAELLLNHQINRYVDKVSFIDDYVRVGDNEGTVMLEVGWHRKTVMAPTQVPTLAFFAAQNPQYVQQAQADVALMANPLEFNKLPVERREAAKMSQEQEVPVVAVVTKWDTVMAEKVVKNCPTVKIMENKNMFVDPSCNGDIQAGGFIGYSFETSKGELREDGRYQNIDHIVVGATSTASEAQHTSNTPATFQFKDEERKRFVAYKMYFKWDTEGDGVLKTVVAVWANNILLQLQLSPFSDEEYPFINVPVNPEPGKWWGEPDGALLIENQKTLGALMRGMIDLLGRSANGQQGMPKQFLDAPNRRKFEDGEDYEYTPAMGNPEQLIILHKYPEIPQSALVLAQTQQSEAESLTGQSMWGNGVNSGSLGDVAAGIKGALAASAKREMSILRRYASGISKLGQKWLSMSKDFLSDEEIIRITNDQFVAITREGIDGKFDVQVDVSSAEEDNLKAQELAFMLQTVGPKVDWNITKKILAEIARLRKMPDLAHEIANFEPQPDPIAVAQAQATLRKLNAEAAEAEARAKSEQARTFLIMAQAKKAGSEADLADLEFVEKETGTEHVREMAKMEAQGESNADLAIVNGLMDQGRTAEAIGYSQLTKSRA
jgi:hypothetical protein